MTRAWMPSARVPAIVFLVLIVAGCNFDGFNAGWMSRDRAAHPLFAGWGASRNNAPAEDVPPATAGADEQPLATDIAPLAQQVQSFVQQVPGQGQPGGESAAAAPPTNVPHPTASAMSARSLAAAYASATVLPSPTALGPNVGSPALPAAAPASAAPTVASSTPPTVPAAAGLSNRPAATAPAEAAASPRPPEVAVASASLSPRVELIEIRPAGPAAAATQPVGTANQPLQPAPGAANNLASLLQELEQAVTLHPQQLDEQFKLRLLYAACGLEAKAAGPIAGADPVQGDLLTAVFRVVTAARQSLRDSASASTALAAAEELRRLLSEQSPVMIPRLALVTRVSSFGDYDAVAPPRFPAGQPVHVFLYTEVANFRTEPTGDQRVRTLLGEKVEIFDTGGKLVWQRAEPSIEDRVLSPRHDFFMTMEVKLPADLPPGDYVLKATVDDKLGATTDQQRLTFSIAGR